MDTKNAIKNLESLSNALDKFANSPKNYNSAWSQMLENMSWEMKRSANELRTLESITGPICDEI